jgi:hypothetical protein
MLKMHINVSTINQKEPTNEWTKYLVHHAHESVRGARNPKWHHQQLIQPLKILKCRFPPITRVDANLMIPTLQIQLCKHNGTTQLIQQVIQLR